MKHARKHVSIQGGKNNKFILHWNNFGFICAAWYSFSVSVYRLAETICAETIWAPVKKCQLADSFQRPTA